MQEIALSQITTCPFPFSWAVPKSEHPRPAFSLPRVWIDLFPFRYQAEKVASVYLLYFACVLNLS